LSLPVFPVKGQSFSVEQDPLPITRTVFATGCYMVPKRDGVLIIGATEEDVGYDKKVSLADIAQLNERACHLVPGLRQASFVRAWAGLRPATPDRMPYLGTVETHPGLWIATGHFRNGILLAPITGEIIADLIVGDTPQVEISTFSPVRFLS
jgi:glycine oxidase